MSAHGEILQRLPAVDQLLQKAGIQDLIRTFPRALVVEEIQNYLEALRLEIRGARISGALLSERLAALESAVRDRLVDRLSPSLRTVINATGVIIHTNVGRAPISPEVAAAMINLACSYSNLEYDLKEGQRGHRDLHFEKRVTRILGCESATVANNNAAAVFLILNTLAQGKKVIVSRGELIEIGGSFRIPAIMERSGAILKEVGTTNKTKISDYREAIDPDTALILRVHPSNYKIVGFTHRPQLSELVQLAREKNIPLVKDAGSGYLFPSPYPFLRDEPTVQAALAEGTDLVCFSGDKLLGGPQAGIIVGKKELVDSVRKNPLMRACRVDKVTYAALEWTLTEYEKGAFPQSIPVYQMLSATAAEIQRRAKRLAKRLDRQIYAAELKEGFSLIGGGSAPEERIPTVLLALRSSLYSVNELERGLRLGRTPVLVRIERDQLILDLRTVLPGQEDAIAAAFDALASPDGPRD